jgi:hypothetical protein
MNRVIGHSPVVISNNHNSSKEYWNTNTESKIFSTSTLGCSWNKFGDLTKSVIK